MNVPFGYCQCGCGGKTVVSRVTDSSRGYVAGQPRAFLPFHRRRLSTVDYIVDDTTGCWVWQLARNGAGGGYGVMRNGGRQQPAHRVYYERLVGPIPEGLVIDHLCRNHACVNPAHLEPVTPRINVLRGETIVAANAAKTHCQNGHPFDAENTRILTSGSRRCRTCQREWQRDNRRMYGRWPSR